MSNVEIRPHFRSLIFELEPISRDKRKEESVFWQEFNNAKPELLGSILSLISKALSNQDKVKHSPFSRLADFEKWGCAIALALGMKETDFINSYKSNIELKNRESIESSPVARTIIVFMKDTLLWSGSPSELLKELSPVAEELGHDADRMYPKDPRWLWKRIKEVKTDLTTYGLEIIHEDISHGDRTITITNKNINNDASNA